MKNKRALKIVALLCCAALLVGATIGATVAYLTSTTNVVSNTFSVGRVKIKLDESAIKKDGNNWIADPDSPRVVENTYRLEPACTYSKDPAVTVEADSEEAYIRAFVTVSKIRELNTVLTGHNAVLKDFFVGRDATKWNVINLNNPVYDPAKDTATFEYRYHTTVSTANGGAQMLEPLFTEIDVPDSFTGDDLASISGMKIEIVAQAIQAAGFADETAAWTAFDNN